MSATASGHIEADPAKCGGRPCIVGTRIRVQDVYAWHELQGQLPEEIVTNYPQLSLADVHAALAYFYDHRDQIERELRVERDEAENMKINHPSKLVQKLIGRDANAAAISS
jgi:uncharacterized protein (DUF433 family)